MSVWTNKAMQKWQRVRHWAPTQSPCMVPTPFTLCHAVLILPLWPWHISIFYTPPSSLFPFFPSSVLQKGICMVVPFTTPSVIESSKGQSLRTQSSLVSTRVAPCSKIAIAKTLATMDTHAACQSVSIRYNKFYKGYSHSFLFYNLFLTCSIILRNAQPLLCIYTF